MYTSRRSPSPPRRRPRSRSPDRRRRSRSGDRDRGRGSRRSRSPSERRKDKNGAKEEANKGPKPLTLKDIISVYPGISLAEAAQRLNAHNSALAMGLPPPTPGGLDPSAILVGGMNTLIGEGGAATKPHREL